MSEIHNPGKRAIDLTDKVFGKLLVIRRVSKVGEKKEIYWLCKCECGEETIVMGKNLKKGATTSCGCNRKKRFEQKLIDLTGKKFGKLTVIKRAEPPLSDKTNKPYWLCKCDCGKTKVILGANLRQNLTKSCGCIKRRTR